MLNTYYDLFIGWVCSVQYCPLTQTLKSQLAVSTTHLVFPLQVYTWRSNKSRYERSVSKGPLLLWGLQICGAQKPDSVHVLPALCHQAVRGVHMQHSDARELPRVSSRVSFTCRRFTLSVCVKQDCGSDVRRSRREAPDTLANATVTSPAIFVGTKTRGEYLGLVPSQKCVTGM